MSGRLRGCGVRSVAGFGAGGWPGVLGREGAVWDRGSTGSGEAEQGRSGEGW